MRSHFRFRSKWTDCFSWPKAASHFSCQLSAIGGKGPLLNRYDALFRASATAVKPRKTGGKSSKSQRQRTLRRHNAPTFLIAFSGRQLRWRRARGDETIPSNHFNWVENGCPGVGDIAKRLRSELLGCSRRRRMRARVQGHSRLASAISRRVDKCGSQTSVVSKQTPVHRRERTRSAPHPTTSCVDT